MPDDVVGVAGERGADHGRDADRVLVHVRLDVLGADRVLALLERHDPRLDVEVAAELLPHDVHVAAEDEVRPVRGLPVRLAPLAPLPLERQRAQHDGLGGPLRARAGGLAGRVEEVGQHPDAPLLDLGRARVLGVVDEVAVQALGDDPLRLRLHPRGHERREVALRVAVQHQLLPDQPHRVDGRHARLRQLVVGHVLADELVAEPALEVVEPARSVVGSAASSAAQDLGLLGRELLLGQDALRLQVGQLLELRDLLVAVILGGRRPPRTAAAAGPAPAPAPPSDWSGGVRRCWRRGSPYRRSPRCARLREVVLACSLPSFLYELASAASSEASRACTGMRPNATSWPPDSRTAFAKGAAQRFSNTTAPRRLPRARARCPPRRCPRRRAARTTRPRTPRSPACRRRRSRRSRPRRPCRPRPC